MDDSDDMRDSDDDLDITQSVRKDLGHEDYIKTTQTPDESSAAENHGPAAPTRMRDAVHDGEKVAWSEDDDSDAYKRFKARKSVKRKAAAASTRRAKAIEREKDVVGKKQRKITKNGKVNAGKEKQWGDETDDDQLMEYTLPDYLQSRRARFDKRTEKLQAAGLKLPPKYDDIDFSDDERLEDLAERPDFPRGTPVAPYKDKQLPKSLGLIPAPIAQWLRDYQVEGTAFLHALFVYQTGGILGDDMGLGKTVQVIAFLTAAFGKTADERDAKRMRKMRRAEVPWYPKALVVCPGTLMENWKDELRRWGWWHVDVYHGDTKEAALEAAAKGRLEIMITTYTTYRTNKSAINMVEWDVVIADECHQLKGRSSETTQSMNEVNALCRIGLTGTAIQNSYDELWTLLNWTNPGKFGPISTWKQSISIPLKTGQSHDATVHQLSKARKTAKALVENLLPQFFLRRMKTLIADQLPKKSDRVVFCPLTETQADAYENCIDSDVIRYIKDSTLDCNCGSGKKQGWCCQQYLPDGGKWQSYVFPAIALLQKLSNHLAILIPQSEDPKDKQDRDLEMLQVAVPDQWRQLYRNPDSIVNYSNPEFCGKWKVLKKLLRFWHGNGDKVLVFSHSVRLLKMLRMLFQHTTYNVSYLDGAMKYEDRAKTVDDFNSDPGQFVFLISTKAGGVGLNITSANKVVVVDPNWNPAYDLQAQDRAYRIGQVRDVEVFRLVSAGTIEEIVYARQIYKQQQANIGYTASTERRYFKGVQENKDQKGEIFGLANLFSFNNENLVLRDVINKTNVAESKAGVTIIGVDLDNPNDKEDGDDPFLPTDKDEPDNENRAMSQLAALIVDEAEEAAGKTNSKRRKIAGGGRSGKKSDPIQAILANAGVEYTHENSEVVGSSKVEASLSRRAQEAGNDIDMGGRKIFASSQSQSQQYQEQSSRGKRRRHHLDDGHLNDDNDDAAAAASNNNNDATDHEKHDEKAGANEKEIQWRYHPPQEVMKRQLCTMAHTFGFADAVDFALVVEGWTQAQRRECLDKFYHSMSHSLPNGFSIHGLDGWMD
ncbi:DNA excision repair protein [Usnea florida]